MIDSFKVNAEVAEVLFQVVEMFQRFLRGILAQVCLDVINGDFEGFGREYVERAGIVWLVELRFLCRSLCVDSCWFGGGGCVFFAARAGESDCKCDDDYD